MDDFGQIWVILGEFGDFTCFWRFWTFFDNLGENCVPVFGPKKSECFRVVFKHINLDA
jgi:hypothetical protein